jgi:hypothetical protein
MPQLAPAHIDHASVTRATPYAYYALFLLIAANLLNYLDRHIVSALSVIIKTDLHFTDAQRVSGTSN